MPRFQVSTKDKRVIVAVDEQGTEVPVLNMLEGDVPFPGEADTLVENLVSLLNGEPPRHIIEVGRNRVFWRPTPNGAELRVESLDDPEPKA
jgi:hypothetical protein